MHRTNAPSIPPVSIQIFFVQSHNELLSPVVMWRLAKRLRTESADQSSRAAHGPTFSRFLSKSGASDPASYISPVQPKGRQQAGRRQQAANCRCKEDTQLLPVDSPPSRSSRSWCPSEEAADRMMQVAIPFNWPVNRTRFLMAASPSVDLTYLAAGPAQTEEIRTIRPMGP